MKQQDEFVTPDQVDLPTTLYKYRDWNHKTESGEHIHRRILLNNEIFLTAPKDFNDPFDAGIPIRYDKMSELEWENFFHKMAQNELSSKQKSYNDEDVKTEIDKLKRQGIHTDPLKLKRFMEDQIERLKDDFGVFSVSEDPVNIQMWSYYANCHTGFCVGLDRNELMYSIKGSMMRVHYHENEKFPDILKDLSGPNDTIGQLLHKAYNWKHEKEVRYTKIIQSGQRVINLQPHSIKEIIFGLNMDENTRMEIIESTSKCEHLKQTKLFQTKKVPEHFKLELEEIPLLGSHQ